MMIRNISRSKKKSTITILLVMLLTVVLNAYIGNIAANMSQLQALPDAVPVYCQITNLNGTRASGLVIEESLIRKMEDSGCIKDGAYTIRMMGGIGAFELEDWKANLNLFITGANRVEAIPGLGAEDIALSAGEQEAFFRSSDEKCIVSSSLMKERGWKIGDTIQLNLYYYIYDDREGILCRPLTLIDVEIAAQMEPVFSADGQNVTDILLPLKTVQACFESQGIPCSMDSASFYMADPFQMNAFKDYMRELGFLEKAPDARDSYKGIALTMRDTIFISSAENLEETVAVMEAFFPPICIFLVLIGGAASFLLTISRKKEITLMRALGVGAARCAAVMWGEQMLLTLPGLLAGGGISLMFGELHTVLATCGVVFLAYMAGVLGTMCWMVHKTSIQILLGEE